MSEPWPDVHTSRIMSGPSGTQGLLYGQCAEAATWDKLLIAATSLLGRGSVCGNPDKPTPP